MCTIVIEYSVAAKFSVLQCNCKSKCFRINCQNTARVSWEWDQRLGSFVKVRV